MLAQAPGAPLEPVPAMRAAQARLPSPARRISFGEKNRSIPAPNAYRFKFARLLAPPCAEAMHANADTISDWLLSGPKKRGMQRRPSLKGEVCSASGQ